MLLSCGLCCAVLCCNDHLETFSLEKTPKRADGGVLYVVVDICMFMATRVVRHIHIFQKPGIIGINRTMCILQARRAIDHQRYDIERHCLIDRQMEQRETP